MHVLSIFSVSIYKQESLICGYVWTFYNPAVWERWFKVQARGHESYLLYFLTSIFFPKRIFQTLVFSCLDFRFISMCKSAKLALCCQNRHEYFYLGEIIDQNSPLIWQYETMYNHFPWHLKNNRSSKFLNQTFPKQKLFF